MPYIPLTTTRFSQYAVCTLLLALSACGGREQTPFTGVKIGKPYEINGVTYTPAKQDDYDKVGDGSWYGPGFHGKRTASGERFDQDDLTAAHPTLPMPSLARVTNLKNGKSIIVRINDRGPFHSKRIIDLSKASAQAINLTHTMPVRVQYLRAETDAYLASLKGGKAMEIDMVAYNEQARTQQAALENAQQELAETAPTDDAASYQSVSIQELDSPGTATSTNATTRSSARYALIADAKADEQGDTPAAISAAVAKPSATKNTASKMVSDKTVALKPGATKPVTLVAAKASEKTAVEKMPAKAAAPSAKFAGKYSISAGAFSTQNNAEALAGKLRSLANVRMPVVVSKAEVSGKTMWRVQAGPFADKAQAEQALKLVQKAGAADARLSGNL